MLTVEKEGQNDLLLIPTALANDFHTVGLTLGSIYSFVPYFDLIDRGRYMKLPLDARHIERKGTRGFLPPWIPVESTNDAALFFFFQLRAIPPLPVRILPPSTESCNWTEGLNREQTVGIVIEMEIFIPSVQHVPRGAAMKTKKDHFIGYQKLISRAIGLKIINQR